MRLIKAEIALTPISRVLNSYGFEEQGLTQQFFTEEIYKHSDPYTPASGSGEGLFKTNVDIGPDFIHYRSPFSNYLWNGKKFVDPKYQIGAFFSESYGFWSRPGILKEETDIDLVYTGAPLRGPFWINRMWVDDGEEITKKVQQYAERRKTHG